jgi:hypothetical protein
MSAITSTPIDAEAQNAPTSGRLFFLDLSGGRILSANPDGSDLKIIINEGRKLPDGLALDVAAGHIYWTNMGDPNRNDGSIMRSDLNGKNMITIVQPGGTFTPKQLQLEKRSGKLYWSDREGMRVMRANLDGSAIETLVDTSLGDSRPGSDPRKWCVGIAVDTDGGKFYWTQKGGHDTGLGRICRTNIEVPQDQSAENRRDIEILYDNLPEPIDLDLDPVNRTLYWTDRGDPPRGNTVNRAPMDWEAENGNEPEILFTHLMEGIGLALDLKGGRMFITDFGGSVYSAKLDGSNRRTLLFAEGNLTGIAYAEVPSADRGGASRVTGHFARGIVLLDRLFRQQGDTVGKRRQVRGGESGTFQPNDSHNLNPLAGGYGVNTPFGVIYGTNITPDTQTGIGRWSFPAFTRAIREGVSRDGYHLYAAFPYTAFTELSDDDINALYASGDN